MNTPLGCLRGKYYIKAAVQSFVFLVVVGCFGVAHLAKTWKSNDVEYHNSLFGRFLQEETELPTSAPTECVSLTGVGEGADPGWLAVFYALGVMYMFLALAIACDEFFVPALEEMSSPRRMNLSMDVAGATLMAAGGSAPELFTALFGTFQESAIGFGTIVGSAVFNVLFVIAMCSLLAKEVLELTWWPLFRDSAYYVSGLVILAVFVGFVSKGEIVWWEATILFSLYMGYILLMWQNANLYKKLTGKTLEYPDEEPEAPVADAQEETPSDEGGRPQVKKQLSKSASIASNLNPSLYHSNHPAHFRWQGTFRAGILKLLKNPATWMEHAGMGIVAKIAGDADYVFRQVDIDGNGHIDREELKQLFNLLECYISPTELEEVFNELDEDNDGTVRQIKILNPES